MGSDKRTRSNLIDLAKKKREKEDDIENSIEDTKESEQEEMPHAMRQEPLPHRPPRDVPAPRQAARPDFRETERTDYPRVTYYVPSKTTKAIKFYSLYDDRKVSEIVREALDQWLDRRDTQPIQSR